MRPASILDVCAVINALCEEGIYRYCIGLVEIDNHGKARNTTADFLPLWGGYIHKLRVKRHIRDDCGTLNTLNNLWGIRWGDIR